MTGEELVIAMTLTDLLLDPSLLQAAKDYFAEHRYSPLIGPDDPPAIHLNKDRTEFVPGGDAAVLLRPGEVRQVSRVLGIEYPPVRNGDGRL